METPFLILPPLQLPTWKGFPVHVSSKDRLASQTSQSGCGAVLRQCRPFGCSFKKCQVDGAGRADPHPRCASKRRSPHPQVGRTYTLTCSSHPAASITILHYLPTDPVFAMAAATTTQDNQSIAGFQARSISQGLSSLFCG